MKLFNTPLKILLLLTITWIIFANLYFGINLPYTATALFILTIIIFAAKFFIKKHHLSKKLAKIPAKKWFYPALIIVILIAGIASRLSFLQFDYEPRWDPGTFYWNAKSLSETGELIQKVDHDTKISHQEYFAMYPYEMNYTGLLAIANTIFGGGLFSVIILNIILDLIGATLAFFILKNLTPAKKWPPLAAATLYFLNPFNVVFSALSLPIIAVNTFIMLVIYLVIKYLRKQPSLKTWQTLAIFTALGLILGFANGFRPIFTIILIAILLTIVYLFISKTIKGKADITTTIAAALLMIISYLAMTQVNFAIVDHYAKQPAARNASGWATYVGSNLETSGKWQYGSPDLAVRNKLWQKYPDDKQAVHNELISLARDRYLSYGLIGNIDLALKKSLIAAGDQSASMYNASSLIGYGDHGKQIIDEIAEIFILCLSIFLAINIFKNWGKSSLPIWIFLTLIILGFFAGSLLVEVKNRYFTIFLPAMILLAAYIPATANKKQ